MMMSDILGSLVWANHHRDTESTENKYPQIAQINSDYVSAAC